MSEAKNKSAQDTVSAENEAAGVSKAKIEQLAEKSKENRKNGGEDVKVSLTNRTNVRFTKNFGKHLKKGDEMEVSDLALQIYSDKGVIEKI